MGAIFGYRKRFGKFQIRNFQIEPTILGIVNLALKNLKNLESCLSANLAASVCNDMLA